MPIFATTSPNQVPAGRWWKKPANTYYLYIKASKVVETAEFILSENKIDIEQEAGYYHFLYATVNSEYNGERGIAQLNGFTDITNSNYAIASYEVTDDIKLGDTVTLTIEGDFADGCFPVLYNSVGGGISTLMASLAKEPTIPMVKKS